MSTMNAEETKRSITHGHISLRENDRGLQKER